MAFTVVFWLVRLGRVENAEYIARNLRLVLVAGYAARVGHTVRAEYAARRNAVREVMSHEVEACGM